MNDFTKEELETINGALNQLYDLCKEKLIDKIQSMIDNHCDHQSDNYTYYKSGIKCTDFLTYASHESPCFLKCIKCGELFR